MTSTTLRQLAPAAAAGLALSLLSTLPAGAHGLAGAGLAAGASHPLLGLDHLLLLLGVGGAAAVAGPSLLLVALAAAISGGLYGALGGNLPGADVLASLDGVWSWLSSGCTPRQGAGRSAGRRSGYSRHAAWPGSNRQQRRPAGLVARGEPLLSGRGGCKFHRDPPIGPQLGTALGRCSQHRRSAACTCAVGVRTVLSGHFCYTSTLLSWLRLAKRNQTPWPS